MTIDKKSKKRKRETVKRWYFKHKELKDEGWKKMKAKRKISGAKWVSENRERKREINRKSYLKNRKKWYPTRRENVRQKEGERRLKLRFQIFQRDNFTCQYCGRESPECILEIDHRLPKSKGGKDNIDNYITSCRECNLGKGDIILKEFQKS